MVCITRSEFDLIADGIRSDRDVILRHNPVGTPEESMLWMLLGCLLSFLSIEESETPCFTGTPTAETYRNAISFILQGRMSEEFDVDSALDKFLSK